MRDPMSVAYDAGLEFGQRLCAEVKRERDRLREILEETDTDLFKTMDCLRVIESERDKLRQALEWIWREMACGGPADIDTQDTLEKLGLLVEVPADEQFREDWDADTMYVLAWKVKGGPR